jgi:phospholipid/cholesterol/gamma-HCH transport system substrate-binding protein
VRWVTRLTTGAVILIIVAGVALVIRSSVPTVKVAGSFRTYAKFRDGSRLAPGSPVVIAGVRVGVIDKLTVEGQLARIDMELQDGLELPVDSFATRRADSLFGDSYVEIIPAGGEDGAGPLRLLKSGDPITHVVEGGSTDALLRGMAAALPRIDNALDTVHDTAIKGRKWVNGPANDRLNGTADWLAEGRIERPLESADRAAAKVDDATSRAAGAVSKARPEVTRTFDRVDQAIASARQRMHDIKDGLISGLHDTRDGLDRIDPQIAQASELMAAIDDGHGDDWKGTLGHLINDPGLADTLEDVTESGREAAAGLNRFRTWLGLRVEYDVFSRQVRFYATAELHARNDKFYLVEMERGPLGGVPNDSLSDVAGTTAFERQQVIHDEPRFTAQFGKHFGMLSIRGGIKDSTFGVGGDALLLDGRLKLSADLYGSFQPTPRLKIAAALAVFRSVYVLAGVDDALNKPGYLPVVLGNPGAPQTFDKVRFGRDYFVGTTLVFTEADIAVLLRVYGAVLVALLVP